jgi:hypothetical protein
MELVTFSLSSCCSSQISSTSNALTFNLCILLSVLLPWMTATIKLQSAATHAAHNSILGSSNHNWTMSLSSELPLQLLTVTCQLPTQSPTFHSSQPCPTSLNKAHSESLQRCKYPFTWDTFIALST